MPINQKTKAPLIVGAGVALVLSVVPTELTAEEDDDEEEDDFDDGKSGIQDGGTETWSLFLLSPVGRFVVDDGAVAHAERDPCTDQVRRGVFAHVPEHVAAAVHNSFRGELPALYRGADAFAQVTCGKARRVAN